MSRFRWIAAIGLVVGGIAGPALAQTTVPASPAPGYLPSIAPPATAGPGCTNCQQAGPLVPFAASSVAAEPSAPTIAPAPEADDDPWRLFPDPIGGFKVTGWMYGTGVYNATNAGTTRYNGPLTQNDQVGSYLNQMWINVSRPLEEEEFGWGATVDVFYGNDYLASQSRGFEARRARGFLPKWWDNQDYGLAIPQAYAEVGTSKYNVRVGHFYTPHGYMTVQAPGNFFNSLPFGFMFTNPFTHWGMMGNAALGDNLSVMFGLVNGWDALDRPRNNLAYMGGVKYTFPEEAGFASCNVITGLEPENLGTGYANRTLVTNVLDFKVDALEFVFENNLGWQQNKGLETSMFYNFVPYLFYKLTDSWKVGCRYEFFHDPGNFAAGARWGNPNNGPNPFNNLGGPYNGNFQSVVCGLNWQPGGSKNINIRPEVRYDWFNGTGTPFDAGTKNHQVFFMVGSYFVF